MTVLLASMLAFVMSLVIHVLWWRWRKPNQQTTALLKLFLIAFPVWVGLGYWIAPLRFHGVDLLYFTLFFVPAGLAYTSFYSLIEQQSPSLSIVAATRNAGPNGLDRAALLSAFGAEDIVSQRIDAAMGNGLIARDGGTLTLTARGKQYAKMFEFAARIFRLRGA